MNDMENKKKDYLWFWTLCIVITLIGIIVVGLLADRLVIKKYIVKDIVEVKNHVLYLNLENSNVKVKYNSTYTLCKDGSKYKLCSDIVNVVDDVYYLNGKDLEFYDKLNYAVYHLEDLNKVILSIYEVEEHSDYELSIITDDDYLKYKDIEEYFYNNRVYSVEKNFYDTKVYVLHKKNIREYDIIYGLDKLLVNFDTGDGSFVQSVEVNDGENIYEPSKPTKDGYEFLYWVDIIGEFDFNSPITENMTLKAIWKTEDSEYNRSYYCLNKFEYDDEDITDLPKNPELDALGKRLYDRFKSPISNHSVSSLFFYKDKIKYEDIPNDLKLTKALQNVSEEKLYYNNNFNYDNAMKVCEPFDTCDEYIYSVSIEDFYKSYYELFGSMNDPVMDDEVFLGKDLSLCYFDNNVIFCYPFITNWQYIKYISAFDHMEISNNKLNVYINVLFVGLIDNRNILFSDIKRTNVIDGNCYTDGFLGRADEVDSKKLLKKYEGRTGVYKMVFEKDTDGNYYWVETDVVKK